MIRLIIIDDHPVVRRGFNQIIAAEEDMQIVGEAGNAREALRIVRETPCDAVVLDISLPDASGLDLLSQLKSELPALPILIMSIHDEEAYALRAFRAGASGYLTKDGLPEELIQAIRKITSGDRYISLSLAEKLASEYVSSGELPHQKLSDRELQILRLIASGKSLKEIGETLCISGKTVSSYRARILEKMNVKTNADLIGYALKNRLIE